MRCPLSKRRIPWVIYRALPLAALLLLPLAVLSAGRLQEWLLSPGPAGPPDPEALRRWKAADAVDPRRLRAEAQARRFYRQPNAGACSGQPVFLLTFVVSKPSHGERRRAIRSSWGSLSSLGGRRLRTLFALGEAASAGEEREIELEASRHGDLVQGSFRDTYLNLTLKTLMALRWASTYCPGLSYLLKADDDVFVNLPALVAHLSGLDPALGDLYLGRVHSSVPVERNVSSQYYVSKTQFPGHTYPRYCSGTAYVLSGDLARRMYGAALSLPLIPIEDVFIGLCAHSLGVRPTPSARMSGSHRVPALRCCYRQLFSSHHVSPAEQPGLWALVHGGTECSTLTKYSSLFICNSLDLLQQARYLVSSLG